MTTQVKVISLTILILVLAGSIAGIMYFHGIAESRKSQVESSSSVITGQQVEVVNPVAPTSTEIWSSVAVGQKINNPFMFNMRTPFASATWMLQDAEGRVLASGFVSSSNVTVDVTGWYAHIPKTKTGWFLVADSLSSAPPYRIPVVLQIKTETVEVYFPNPQKTSGVTCDEVFPVKRTIVSTGGEALVHYQAALNELVKGPTPQESAAGYATALPEGVKVMRVGQDESGRFVGDFSSALSEGISDRCRLTLIKSQIQETLKTVPLSGRTLNGRVYIEGQEANF